MKTLQISAAIGVCFLLTGCGTIIRLGENREKDMRFAATKMDAALLFAYWAPSGHGSWNPVSGMWFLTPATLVDIPFAVVLDTILLPHDWYSSSKNVGAEVFWRTALASTSASPSVAECIAHYTPYSRTIIDKTVYDDYSGAVSGETLDLLVRMACPTNERTAWISLDAIARHKNLQPCTWVSLYHAATNGAPNYFLLASLARSQATPIEYFSTLAKHGSYDVRRSVAINPLTPPDVLRTLAADATECIKREKQRPSPRWWDINNSQSILDLMQKHRPKTPANQPSDRTR